MKIAKMDVFASQLIRDFEINFKGHIWGNNGPALITRVYQNLSMKSLSDMYILPPNIVYPIHWSEWTSIYEANCDENKWKTIQSISIGLHIWNKMGKKKYMKNSILSRATSKYCPVSSSHLQYE